VSTIPLRAFATKVRASNRLGFGDLRRLQRDVLPDGIATREEAEMLLAIDATVARLDIGWSSYLAGAIRAFVLSSSDPPGPVDPETKGWLVDILSQGSARSAAAVAREIAADVPDADDRLLAIAGRSRRRRRGSVRSGASEPEQATG
jgi:hypothetical protein